ncbi:hypothetical protein C8Q76DRAFT_729525 [Earliella scabrosa]|nr:hypothetical protein C8Q76DRAFT_729525 [Earliella scabrosa]
MCVLGIPTVHWSPKYRRCSVLASIAQPHLEVYMPSRISRFRPFPLVQLSPSFRPRTRFLLCSSSSLYPTHLQLAMSDHWRMQFNNYCQRNNLQAYVSWPNPMQTGPQNAPTWTASVYFNGIEYGRGSANTVGAAREIAAEMALKALWSQRGY